MRGALQLHFHANGGHVIVDHVSAHGPYVTHMRGTLLVNSVEHLRQLGVYERYLELLEASARDHVAYAIAASWIPIEIALAHYQACDALKLGERDCQTLGSMMAQRIADTFLGTVLRVTRRAGVESFWSLMSQNSRIWDRMYLGGGVTVIQTGPKDVIVENHGLPLVTSRHWRFAYEAYWKALGAIFTKVAFVKAVHPREAHPHRIALAGSWV